VHKDIYFDHRSEILCRNEKDLYLVPIRCGSVKDLQRKISKIEVHPDALTQSS